MALTVYVFDDEDVDTSDVFEVTVGAHEIGESYELTIDTIPEYNDSPTLKSHPKDRYSSNSKSHFDMLSLPMNNMFSLSSPFGLSSPLGMFA